MEGFFGVIFMSVVSIFVHVLLLEYPNMMINEYVKLKMLIASSGRLILLLVACSCTRGYLYSYSSAARPDIQIMSSEVEQSFIFISNLVWTFVNCVYATDSPSRAVLHSRRSKSSQLREQS